MFFWYKKITKIKSVRGLIVIVFFWSGNDLNEMNFVSKSANHAKTEVLHTKS